MCLNLNYITTQLLKMKVSLQGEEVHELLWDIIAARVFEKDLYFEQAVTELRGFPKLEGTRHVNMALIVKLIASYFFNPGEFDKTPRLNGSENDDYLFQQGPTRGYAKIQKCIKQACIFIDRCL